MGFTKTLRKEISDIIESEVLVAEEGHRHLLDFDDITSQIITTIRNRGFAMGSDLTKQHAYISQIDAMIIVDTLLNS